MKNQQNIPPKFPLADLLETPPPKAPVKRNWIILVIVLAGVLAYILLYHVR